MAENLDHWTLQFSQKVFAGMLRAYPNEHRREFGAAMAQLFREQCRDAWNESRGWGLFKLWLRVLPDLIKTSVLEQIANLNRKKSMTEKIANLSYTPSPVSIFLRVAIPVFLATVLASVVITSILPKTYSSTARIVVNPDPDLDQVKPDFIQTNLAIIKSPVVLNQVIQKLDLSRKWGQKYALNLNANQTMAMLSNNLAVVPLPNTKLISVKVWNGNPEEASEIANAIVDAYKKYRTDSLLQRLKDENARVDLQTAASLPELVQIVNVATWNYIPVRPNKRLNTFVGVVIGISFGLATGAISALITSKRRNHGGGNVTTN